MSSTDISELGLERLICTALTGHPCDPPKPYNEPPEYSYGPAKWICGFPNDYNRE
jgi:type I restriction enzyme, R subunit